MKVEWEFAKQRDAAQNAQPIVGNKSFEKTLARLVAERDNLLKRKRDLEDQVAGLNIAIKIIEDES